MAKITYDEKVALNEEPSVAEINKVTDDNMNEIKTSVNDLYDTVSTNTSNISSLTTTTNNLVARTTDTVIIRTVTTDDSTTFEAFGASYHGGTAPTISGYTPLMCYEATGRGNSAIRGYTNIPNATNNAIGCWFNNFTNTSATVAGFDFKVIYIKNPL